jgi:glucosamine--fructose-6-phosphate aminotransferase (isomerizing)
MSTLAFDPERPLPGPPDPWAATDPPAGRDGPPYAMTQMIAAEPALSRRVLAHLAGPSGPAAELAAAIREAALAGAPIVAVGCGTSEHGALGFAAIVRDAMQAAGLPGPGPIASQALEAALQPQDGGLCIGISHEGSTAATIRAMEAGRASGARIALVTVSERAPAAELADVVLATQELDQSWCHTVGYLAPLLAGVAVGAVVRDGPDGAGHIQALLAAGLTSSATASAEAIARELAGARHIVVVASGVDRVAGRELTLKIEEGAWIPSAYRDLETFLHGHMPATDETTGLVLLLTDRLGESERTKRARQLLTAVRAVGVRAAAIVSAAAASRLPDSLTPSGRLVVPAEPSLPAPVASLFATATPLQLLTERIARARGTDPDPIRRHDPRYANASALAES